jgi:hypothetical protein
MAFNPELGSTSPAVLLDNAERLDKLVNGNSPRWTTAAENLCLPGGITADIEMLASLDTSNSTFPDEPSGSRHNQPVFPYAQDRISGGLSIFC